MSETVMHIIGGAMLLGVVIWAYMSIPEEDPENVAARARHGKAK